METFPFHPLIYLYEFGLMDPYSIDYIIFITLLFCPIFGQQESLQAGPCPFNRPHYSLINVLLSGTRCCRFFLFFPSPSPTISNFSKDPCYWRVVFKNKIWAIRMLIATGKHIEHMYETNIDTHIYLFYILYILKTMSSHWYL